MNSEMIDGLPQYVEIETSSLCNRSCQWCPNHYLTRSRELKHMEWALFKKVIGELESEDYGGKIALHNYNEPLLNKRLFLELDYVKKHLPASKPRIYTNGDMLSSSSFLRLIGIPLLYLRITLYQPLSPGPEEAYKYIKRWLEQRRISMYDWQFCRHRNGFGAYLESNQAQVQIVVPDISLFNYRGGSVPVNEDYDRKNPCYMTEHSASVDFNGNFKMCCNVVPELSQHQQYIVGNVSKRSFLSMWHDERMQEWRQYQQESDWSSSPICRHCRHYSVKV